MVFAGVDTLYTFGHITCMTRYKSVMVDNILPWFVSSLRVVIADPLTALREQPAGREVERC